MDTAFGIVVWIFSAFGAVGVVTGAAYGFFKFLGAKWLDTKFQERLEAYKHEQHKELEELKFKINTLMDRTVKLHQREFDVLPETWGRLIDAYGYTQSVISSFQQYPDVNRMAAPQLEEFLAKSPLRETEKDELRSAEDRLKYYIKVITWHRIVDAKIKLNEFRMYLLKNGIFIPSDLKDKFTALEAMVFEALIESEFNERDEVFPRPRPKAEELGKKGQTLLKSLEQDVQGRFWNSEATKV
jgi:hypothetical protein